jgi:hypothetical protein
MAGQIMAVANPRFEDGRPAPDNLLQVWWTQGPPSDVVSNPDRYILPFAVGNRHSSATVIADFENNKEFATLVFDGKEGIDFRACQTKRDIDLNARTDLTRVACIDPHRLSPYATAISR